MPGVTINSPHPVDAIAAAANVANHDDVAVVAVADSATEKRSPDAPKDKPDHSGQTLKAEKKNSK